jgi:hypothetical protein
MTTITPGQLAHIARDTVEHFTLEKFQTNHTAYARYPAYRYGDVLDVTGKLETPQPFDDFDYKDYLARQGSLLNIKLPENRNFRYRQRFQTAGMDLFAEKPPFPELVHCLTRTQGALAQGFLLGLRGNIPYSQEPLTMVAVGGTATTLASVEQGLEEFIVQRIHGFVLKKEALKNQLLLYRSKTIEERKRTRRTRGFRK